MKYELEMRRIKIDYNKIKEAYNCKTDGASLGNPGNSYAIALFDKKIGETNRFFWEGYGTNNIAEYQGLLLALKYVPINSKLNIETDSQLIVRQVKGIWRCNYKHLRELKETAFDYIREKNIDFDIIWIPRGGNTADLVLKRHLKKQGILIKERR